MITITNQQDCRLLFGPSSWFHLSWTIILTIVYNIKTIHRVKTRKSPFFGNNSRRERRVHDVHLFKRLFPLH